MLKRKPKTLIGAEMIFEIATSLQDILDQTWMDPNEAVPLDEERTAKEEAARVSALQDNALRREQDLRLQEEEEQMLQELVRQRESSSVKNASRSLESLGGNANNRIIPAGVIKFERPSRPIKRPEGVSVTIDMVYQKAHYRNGRLCEVMTVHPYTHDQGEEINQSAPFLVLKEYHVSPMNKDEPSMKRAVQNLESKLEYHMNLSSHQSIIQPLNFHLQRSYDEDALPSGWKISVLMEMAERQSLQETLDIVDRLDVRLLRAWSLQLIEGLQHYHRHGSAHGDVHLGNILLRRDREAERGDRKITTAVLSDGGFERDLHFLKTGAGPKNSPIAWTAPELINASASDEAIPATDIWEFGRCFLQMAFGVGILSEHPSGPMSLIEELRLTSSLRSFLTQVFNSNPKKRSSAWDLLHLEFFRNDDALLEGTHTEESRSLEASASSVPASRMRRESTHAEASSSRYVKDFVEDGRLGKGGFGEVFRARNKVDGQPYAIKKVKARSKAALDPVIGEVTVLSRLNHPNVVRYFASWIEDQVSVDNADLSGSSADDYTSSLTSVGHKPVLPASSRGLDFISSNNAQVVFAADGFEEEGSTEGEDDSEIESDENVEPIWENKNGHNDAQDSSTGSEQDTGRFQTQSIWTVLYIQMEYCKQEVNLT